MAELTSFPLLRARYLSLEAIGEARLKLSSEQAHYLLCFIWACGPFGKLIRPPGDVLNFAPGISEQSGDIFCTHDTALIYLVWATLKSGHRTSKVLTPRFPKALVELPAFALFQQPSGGCYSRC
jgi:hypothetical protein